MASNAIVQLSGPTASFLSYDVMNALGDQEGFLLGNITTKVMDAVSDSQQHYETKEIVIRIDSHLPCTKPFAYYNGSGQVSQRAIKNILGDRCKDLVGCYRFRRNSTLEPFLRETVVHKNIQRLLPEKRQEHFLLALLTATTSKSTSTHTLDHRFFRIVGEPESLLTSVVSLPASCHSEYRNAGRAADAVKRQALFEERLSLQAGASSTASSSVAQIDDVHATLQTTLRDASEQLISSEEQIACLKMEICKLNMELKNVGASGETANAEKRVQ